MGYRPGLKPPIYLQLKKKCHASTKKMIAKKSLNLTSKVIAIVFLNALYNDICRDS